MNNDFNVFVNYVESFYGNVPNALYPIGATRKMIIEATKLYIDDHIVPWGGGDSVDRENVRDIMIDKFNLKFPEGKIRLAL